ncbi:MAG: TlpA family protein disulfide reductase [Actinobacteria bacterium]|nr:TlpA family protein disulfide reductase [Actinomycetota bacterium]
MSLGTLALVLRLALAAVFALAAVTKLGRRSRTEAALASFGVPPAFRPTVAATLPLAELAVAVALLPAASVPYAAVAATLMLAAFTLAVARVLHRGERVECNCFGSLGSDEVSRSTLLRDLALLLPAAFLAVVSWGEPGPGALAWITGLDGLAAVAILAGVALAAAVVGIGMCLQLMRQNGRLLERLEALEGAPGGAPAAGSPPTRERHTGRPVPAFSLPDLDGGEVDLDGLLAQGRELLLVFSDPGCHACNPVLPEVGRLQRTGGDGPLPVVMSLGDAEINRVKASEHGLELVLLQEDFDLARALGVSGMPGAVLVDRDGRIAAEPAENSDKVRELLAGLTPPPPAARLEVTVVGGGR